MPFIGLGTINKKVLFAVFGGGFKLVANIILYRTEVKMNSHPCILGINAGLGLSLSIIPLLILQIKNNCQINFNLSSEINDTPLIYYDSFAYVKDQKRKKKFLYILMISILDFLQKFLTFFYKDLFIENFWIFDSFLILCFSILILKIKVYAHHFFSLIMIIIIGIVLNVINNYDKNIKILQILITLFTEIFYCLENVICKFAMDVKFSTPYEICFLVGVFELIIFIIFLIIFSNVPMKPSENINHVNDNYIDDFSAYINKLDFKESMVFILCMLLRCIFILFGYIIVEYFTPAHVILILIIGEVSFLFIDVYDWKLYVQIVFFVFLVFFILIFVEIIELNVFGLQKNTKKNISNRSEKEESDYTSRNSSINDLNDINEERKSRNASEIDMQRLSIID